MLSCVALDDIFSHRNAKKRIGTATSPAACGRAARSPLHVIWRKKLLRWRKSKPEMKQGDAGGKLITMLA